MKNRIVLIYGMPSSGKTTLAERLKSEHGYAVADNHYFQDFFKPFTPPPYGTDRWPQFMKQINKLRHLLYATMIEFQPKDKELRVVFTAALTNYGESPAALKQLAKKLDAEFIPIKLVARTDILKVRCNSEFRKSRGKMYDADILEKWIAARRLQNIRHKNLLQIDVSDITEDQVFNIANDHINRICETIN